MKKLLLVSAITAASFIAVEECPYLPTIAHLREGGCKLSHKSAVDKVVDWLKDIFTAAPYSTK